MNQVISRLLRQKPLGAAAGIVCVLFVLSGLFAGALAPYGVNQISPAHRLQPPSAHYLFGTDNLGRDVFTRCLYGARVSVIVGFGAAGLATVISVAIGIFCGYFGGTFDLLVQRFVDAWMIFPELIVLIVAASVFGPGIAQIILVLGLAMGIAGSRVVRGAVIAVRENLYVQAALSVGSGSGRILWRHVLPNVLAPVIVLFTSRVAAAILAESGLSFLGLGPPPPTATWGGMLSGAGRAYMIQGPWLPLAPGLCLTSVVFSISMFGDALRDVLDPHLRAG
jgi:peptide/nickel transport system permease protein